MMLEKLIDKVPKFMHLEFERIETFGDLMFQVLHEIDLAETGVVEWTVKQLHCAKMFSGRVRLAVLGEMNHER